MTEETRSIFSTVVGVDCRFSAHTVLHNLLPCPAPLFRRTENTLHTKMQLLSDVFATIIGSTVLFWSPSSMITRNDMMIHSPNVVVVHAEHQSNEDSIMRSLKVPSGGPMLSWLASPELLTAFTTEKGPSSQSLPPSSSTSPMTTSNQYENYLPRRLYPATYGKISFAVLSLELCCINICTAPNIIIFSFFLPF